MSANIGDVVDAAGHFRVYLGAAAGAGKTYADDFAGATESAPANRVGKHNQGERS